MNKYLIIALMFFTACKKEDNNNNTNLPAAPGVVAFEGMNAWSLLSSSEKAKVDSWNTLFVHQSVGGDLEGGCEDNGFGFDYLNYDEVCGNAGLYGGLFNAGNGNPMDKILDFQNRVALNSGNLKVVCFKFGYDDIEESTLESVKVSYKNMVDGFRASGLRILHVTPPLVYDVTYNSAKMDMRNWMIETFKSDIIFDLQDIESRNLANGNRCEENGIWQICAENRSTPSCPSEGQGVDTPQQGHLCSIAAAQISKAFLYAIYQAGK